MSRIFFFSHFLSFKRKFYFIYFCSPLNNAFLKIKSYFFGPSTFLIKQNWITMTKKCMQQMGAVKLVSKEFVIKYFLSKEFKLNVVPQCIHIQRLIALFRPPVPFPKHYESFTFYVPMSSPHIFEPNKKYGSNDLQLKICIHRAKKTYL